MCVSNFDTVIGFFRPVCVYEQKLGQLTGTTGPTRDAKTKLVSVSANEQYNMMSEH